MAFISFNTVKTHSKSISRKVDPTSAIGADAVTRARWLPPGPLNRADWTSGQQKFTQGEPTVEDDHSPSLDDMVVSQQSKPTAGRTTMQTRRKTATVEGRSRQTTPLTPSLGPRSPAPGPVTRAC